MRVRILAVGTRMPDWVAAGFQEYAKRIPARMKVDLVEICPGQRTKSSSVVRAIEEESSALLTAIQSRDYVVALDVPGKVISTEQLAEKLSNWELSAEKSVVILIGGPDGLSKECLQRANESWSLSAMTLPHPLVRILLIEQLYRAAMINAGHPYHRE